MEHSNNTSITSGRAQDFRVDETETPATPTRHQAREHARDQAGAGASPAPAATPTNAEIAEYAYQRYISRGGQHGHALDDWLEAERALMARRTDATSPPAQRLGPVRPRRRRDG
jgi:hypothetical protein